MVTWEGVCSQYTEEGVKERKIPAAPRGDGLRWVAPEAGAGGSALVGVGVEAVGLGHDMRSVAHVGP